MATDDRRLVRRCLAGERAAFDALYDRHAPRVYHLLKRLTGSDAEAEDLAQETFLAAYRGLASWRGEAAFTTWLCGIAFRLYAGSRRRARPETEALTEELLRAPPEADPLAACLRGEKRDRIEAAIARLPDLSREAFVLVAVEGFSYREAAEWLGVPIGTVKSRIWRAVGSLQTALADLVERGGEGVRQSRPAPPSACPVSSSSDLPTGGH